MYENVNWESLVGERVLAKLSTYDLGDHDMVVTGYRENKALGGFVNFDGEKNWYNEKVLTLVLVHKSKKFPNAYTWD
jgi:hypothetical protein